MTNLDLLKQDYEDAKKIIESLGIKQAKVVELNIKPYKAKGGNCKKVSASKYIITLSSYLFRPNITKEDRMNVVIHELLHSCEKGMSHTGMWKVYANKVNKNYPQYKIERTVARELWDKMKDEVEANTIYKYIAECPECGTIWKRTRESNLIKYPNRYRCGKCNHLGLRVEKLQQNAKFSVC